MYEVKLSSKNQIVIPRQVRNALRVKAGDKIIIVTRGDSVILLRKPKRYAQVTAGMGKGVYSTDYLKKERDSWQ